MSTSGQIERVVPGGTEGGKIAKTGSTYEFRDATASGSWEEGSLSLAEGRGMGLRRRHTLTGLSIGVREGSGLIESRTAEIEEE